MMIETTAIAITPPNSCESVPLTPPVTDPKSTSHSARIVDFLRLYKAGSTASLPHVRWHKYQLQPGEFEEALSRLKAEPDLYNFVADKVHYDYFESSQTLLIRIPTQIHETVIAMIKEAITIQLRELEKDENKEVANFARLVRNIDSGKLEIPNIGNHDPDGSFKHKEAMWPGVIIEAAYSQDKKDLARLADDYIVGTDDSIRVIVGISIDYPSLKNATLSVWRGEYKNEAGVLSIMRARQ